MGAQISFLDGPPASSHLADMPGYLDDPEKTPVMEGVSILEGASDSTINGGTFNAAGRDIIANTTATNTTTTVTVNNIVVNLVDKTPLTDIAILHWLSAINYRSIQMDNFEKATPNTCLWFIESKLFRQWLLGHLLILWGTGMPGSGKTVLASIVIDYLQKYAKSHGSKVAVAFAYCRYTEPVPVQQILAALVRQLLERYPFHYPLVNAVDMSQVFETFFCALDGLDEAAPDTQFKLLDALSTVKASYFITSRPLEPLHSVLPNAHFFAVVARDQDIWLMVAQKLRESPRVVSMLDADGKARQQEVVSKITSKSNGMQVLDCLFLHATTQIETVACAVNIRDALNSLERLPVKISEMYAETVKRIDLQSEASSRLARKALIRLLHAGRAMTFWELRYALAINTEFPLPDPDNLFDELALVDSRTLLSICCGLVTLDGVDGARLVHMTAYESLPGVLAIDRAESHAMLAIACMRQLRATHPSCPRLSPLGPYAISQWPKHVNSATGLFTDPTKPYIIDLINLIRHPTHLPVKHRPRTIWSGDNSYYISDPSRGVETVPRAPPPLIFVNLPLHALALQAPGVLCRLLAMDACVEVVGFIHEVINMSCDGVTLLMVLPSSEPWADCLHKLLSFGDLKINQMDERGMTALHRAAWKGDAKLIQVLSQRLDIDMNVTSDDGLTPLMTAVLTHRTPVPPDGKICPGDHVASVRTLIGDSRVDVSLANPEGYTALGLAAQRGHIEMVDAFLTSPHLATESWASSALRLAVHNSHRHLILFLLQNHPTRINREALIYCFWWCLCDGLPVHREVLEVLLAIPCLLNTQQLMIPATLLVLHSQGVREAIVDQLAADCEGRLNSMADLDLDGDTLATTLLDLLPNKAKILAPNATQTAEPWNVPSQQSFVMSGPGQTPAALDAVADGRCPGSLHHSTSTSTPYHLGDPPSTSLDMVLRRGCDSIAGRLLSFRHLQPDYKDLLERTLQAKNRELSKVILSCPGFSPIHIYHLPPIWSTKRFGDDVDTVDRLISLPGLDVNALDEDGWTILMWASWHGQVRVVQRLLRVQEIQINTRNPQGRNAWHLAKRCGGSTIMRLLEVHTPPVEQDLVRPDATAARVAHGLQ
ncbi:hypothetical protein BKA70DRAFT_1578200 [Coprinopsis sp. MPI-PUGE-AT-0042]|nr:hypothetical protein BKA70DRAFT_1578200 [Coprinopsis sp. MPI-PUGE-AT-0042]